MAEIIRKREDKISEEERKKKEERLKMLQQKLAQIEEKEKQQKEAAQQKEEAKPVIAPQKTAIELEAEQLLKNAGVTLSEEDIESNELDQKAAVFDNMFEKMLELNIDIPEMDEIDPEKVFGGMALSEKDMAEKAYKDLVKKHPWLEETSMGFMYTMPNVKDKRAYESWLNDWMNVFFDHALITKSHFLYPKNMTVTKPFNNFTERLTEILAVCNGMVKKGTAKWVDKKKQDKLRVEWKTMSNWMDDVVNWARDNAISSPVFIHDLQDAMEDFSTLPEEVLDAIFKMIEKNKLGKPIKVDSATAIKFNL